MNIIQINNTFSGTGVENVMRNLGTFLEKNNHKVYYIVSSSEKAVNSQIIKVHDLYDFLAEKIKSIDKLFKISLSYGGIPVDDLGNTLLKKVSINLRIFYPISSKRYEKIFTRIYTKLKPDIIHGHNIIIFTLAPIVSAKKLKLPTILTIHGVWPACPIASFMQLKTNKPCNVESWSKCKNYCSLPFINVAYYMRKLRQKLIANTDMFVAVSNYVKKKLCKFGYPSEKITVIHNGIDTNIFKPISNEYENYVLHIGRLSLYKGSHIVLALAKRMYKKYPQIKFIFVGRVSKSLVYIAKKLRNMIILGWVSLERLIDLYSKSLCVLVPSVRYEPFPLVVLEAMSCGAPVIASNRGGIPEAVKHGDNGFLIEPYDISSIEKYILYLYDNPPERRRLGRNARNTVVSRFSLKIMGEKYLSVYKQFL